MMGDSATNNKRIAKNTILLYFRMIVIMGVSLFTSRVILQTLGVEDFGIYNVVAGIVAMFGFISGSLTTASQRYITFELGRGSNGNMIKVFSSCLSLHIILALLIAVIAEPIGVWFICNKLMIPESRIVAAIWVFQFSILSMIVMFISVPYNALIVAYERMDAFAMVSIIEVVLRLAIAYSLFLFRDVDKLIIYGCFMFVAQLIVRLCYTAYCKRNFPGIKYIRGIDRPLFIEMGKFASWSIFGNLAYITYTQGLNVLLGTFFNPSVNAARGIAVQVQGAVNSFVNSFQSAINPQITKNYAGGNIEDMIMLVFRSSRFSFYLLMILTLPVLLRTSEILNLWLVNVPDYTVVFVRIILITTWINSIANPLIVSVKASGKVKTYESTVGGLMIAILPLSYLFLKFGHSPEVVFYVHLSIECVAMAFRIWNTKQIIRFSYDSYFRKVILRIVGVAVGAVIIPMILSYNLSDGCCSSMFVIFSSIITSILAIVIVGLEKNEKVFLLKKIVGK